MLNLTRDDDDDDDDDDEDDMGGVASPPIFLTWFTKADDGDDDDDDDDDGGEEGEGEGEEESAGTVVSLFVCVVVVVVVRRDGVVVRAVEVAAAADWPAIHSATRSTRSALYRSWILAASLDLCPGSTDPQRLGANSVGRPPPLVRRHELSPSTFTAPFELSFAITDSSVGIELNSVWRGAAVGGGGGGDDEAEGAS